MILTPFFSRGFPGMPGRHWAGFPGILPQAQETSGILPGDRARANILGWAHPATTKPQAKPPTPSKPINQEAPPLSIRACVLVWPPTAWHFSSSSPPHNQPHPHIPKQPPRQSISHLYPKTLHTERPLLHPPTRHGVVIFIPKHQHQYPSHLIYP